MDLSKNEHYNNFLISLNDFFSKEINIHLIIFTLFYIYREQNDENNDENIKDLMLLNQRKIEKIEIKSHNDIYILLLSIIETKNKFIFQVNNDEFLRNLDNVLVKKIMEVKEIFGNEPLIDPLLDFLTPFLDRIDVEKIIRDKIKNTIIS